MLDVQAALTSARVPGYRDAFQPTPGVTEPPGVYCVYQITEIPTWYADDAPTATLTRALLYLYGVNSPKTAQAAIDSAMKAQDFELRRKRDDREPNSGRYVIISEWEGID